MKEVIKNSKRVEASQKREPYKPEYMKLNIKPTEMNPPNVDGDGVVLSETPFSNKRQTLRNKEKLSTMINVGNNHDHVWTSIDGTYFDENGNEVKLDPNQKMIDNNYIDEEIPVIKNKKAPQKKNKTNDKIEPGDFILMLSGKIVTTGTIEHVQNEVAKIIFNEETDIHNVDLEDIVVLKRIKIKVGVFLE